MSKKVVQDILPPTESRSIRKIPLPEKRNAAPNPTRNEMPPEIRTESNQPPVQQNYNNNRANPKKFKLWKILVPVFLVIVIFLGLFAFGKAEINITPRKLSFDVDQTISASKTGSPLPFQIKTVKKEVSREVEATGEEVAERRASGEIIIFNN